MIISQFRKFTPLNIGLLVGMGLLLCAGVFSHLPAALETNLFGPALVQLISPLGAFRLSPVINVLLALFITLIQALYINSVFNRHNFFNRPSFLIALMYLTLASLTLPFLVLSPVLLCNFLLIWMLDKLMNIYHRQVAVNDLFDLGLLTGAGSLIYLPFAGMLLMVWAGLRLFRPFYWREWIAPLMGMLTVYFLVGVAYFWNGQEHLYLQLWTSVAESRVAPLQIEPYDLVILLPVFLLLVLSLNTLRKTIFKRIVHIRKSVQLLFIALLAVLVAYLLRAESEHSVTHFLLAVPPLSVYLAYYFAHADKTWVFESLYGIFLLMILFFQFL